MAELKCTVDNCVYNKEDCCCKGDIMVGGKHACDCEATCCDSFAQSKGDTYKSALEHPCQTISIDCEATNCKYNSEYKCHAERVEIKGCGACNCRETLCSTFQEK